MFFNVGERAHLHFLESSVAWSSHFLTLAKVRFSNNPRLPCAPYQPEHSALHASWPFLPFTPLHTPTLECLLHLWGRGGGLAWWDGDTWIWKVRILFQIGLSVWVCTCVLSWEHHRAVSVSACPLLPALASPSNPSSPAYRGRLAAAWADHGNPLILDTWTTSHQLQLQSFV